jgi:hypothetical protein
MADKPNRITDGLFEQDSNTRRFHLGNAPQAGIPPDLTDEEKAALDKHRAQIHAPDSRPRFKDEHGEEIAVPAQGLVITDPTTGAVAPITKDSMKASEKAAKEAETDAAKARTAPIVRATTRV